MFETHGFQVERNYNLGGTLICFEALKNREIDIYPEYTGTISEQILQSDAHLTLSELREQMERQFELEISEPYGFNNTYALAVKEQTSDKYDLENISDLQSHEFLKFAFSYEFLKRKDGWHNLADTYKLPQSPIGIEHGLAYQAIDEGKIDLLDIYSTDGEINRYNLKILRDDKKFFPVYNPAPVVRKETLDKYPEIASILQPLTQLTTQDMQELNKAVDVDKKSVPQVAADWLTSQGLI